MKSKLLLTIIMAEYNTPSAFLELSIESILKQTLSNFEFIIVDDRGNNDLGKIVEKYNDSRIKIIRNKKNKGLVYSLNIAAKNASSKFLVRMDTDDIAMPSRLKVLYSFITSHPEYDVVGSRAVQISEKGEEGIISSVGEKTKREIIKGDMPIHPTTIINKKAFDKVGGYKDYNRAEDRVLWSELVINEFRIYVIEDVLLKYRVNSGDYSKRKISKRAGELKARIDYYPKLEAKPLDYIYILKSILSGIAPIFLVKMYRRIFILRQDSSETHSA